MEWYVRAGHCPGGAVCKGSRASGECPGQEWCVRAAAGECPGGVGKGTAQVEQYVRAAGPRGTAQVEPYVRTAGPQGTAQVEPCVRAAGPQGNAQVEWCVRAADRALPRWSGM